MRKIPLAQSLGIIRQGSFNWAAGRPVVVSFEVTDACTCYCRHCDHGGPRDESRNLPASDYRRYSETLKPCVAQVSGGEPLLRQDLCEIVGNIKRADGLPYVILVSTWSLMTEQRYLDLRAAGVDQFSVSLDFPDQRHDDFRCYPGLFEHLDDIIPRVAKLGHDDIVLNTCITSANVSEISRNADQARKWGVNICYSAYSPRRTGDWGYFLQTPQELAVLRSELALVESRRNGSNWIVSAPSTLEQTQTYFERRGAPGCTAGLRFLVVTSDGMLQPCSMHLKRYALEEQERMVREFTANNFCDECYVAIRSNLDKSFAQLLGENVRRYFSFGAAAGTRSNN